MTTIKHRTVSGLNVRIIVKNTIPIRSPQKCSPPCSLVLQIRPWGSEGSSVLSCSSKRRVRWEHERGGGLGSVPSWLWGSGYPPLRSQSPSLLRADQILFKVPPSLSWIEGALFISPASDPRCSVLQEKQPHGLPSQTPPLTEFISTELLKASGPYTSCENNLSEAGVRAHRMQSHGHWSSRWPTWHNSAFPLFTIPSCPVYFSFPVPSVTSNQSQPYIGFPVNVFSSF